MIDVHQKVKELTEKGYHCHFRYGALWVQWDGKGLLNPWYSHQVTDGKVDENIGR